MSFYFCSTRPAAHHVPPLATHSSSECRSEPFRSFGRQRAYGLCRKFCGLVALYDRCLDTAVLYLFRGFRALVLSLSGGCLWPSRFQH